MEYRDRIVYAGCDKEFVLAKYDENNEKHKKYLQVIESLKPYMASCLKVYPQIHAVSQCKQSYLLLDRFEEFIGSIVIDPSVDFKELTIKVLLNDKYFNSVHDKLEFLNNLKKSLGLLFFNFKVIKIELKNYITGKEKLIFQSWGLNNLNECIIYNSTNYDLIPKILEEVRQNKTLFNENFTDENLYNFIFKIFNPDKDLMKDFKEDKLTSEELYCYTQFITLKDNIMNDGNKMDVFSDGSIILKNKLIRVGNDGDYIAYYNVLKNDFNLFYNNGEFGEKNRVFELVNNSDYMRLNFYGNNKCIIKKFKKDNFQDLFYKYVGKCCFFEIEISTDENGKIESCSANFKIMEKDSHSIVKTFCFWISHSDKIIHLKTISNGVVKVNYPPIESENLQDLIDCELSFDVVCNFIREFSIIISDIMGDESILKELNKEQLNNAINFENMAFEVVKAMKKEIYKFPHLKVCLESYIDEYKKNMIQDKLINFKKNY